MQRSTIQVVTNIGGVLISESNPCDTGEHSAVLDLCQTIEINTTRSKTTGSQNGKQSLSAAGVFRSDDGEIKTSIAAASQKTVGDATGWQKRADHNYFFCGGITTLEGKLRSSWSRSIFNAVASPSPVFQGRFPRGLTP